MMTSKNYIKDLQMFINEAYSDNEPLQDNQVKSKKVFNDYCNKIKQDLERLEELENDRLLDRAEKEELERKNAVLNHNLEEKVEVIADLKRENQELKEEINELSKDKTCFEKQYEKLKKAIEIIEKWRRSRLYDLIDNLKSQDIEDYKILEEIIFGEVLGE